MIYKNSILILITLLCFLSLKAKENEIKFPIIQLLKIDSSSILTNDEIEDNKKTVFINFSPTCDHCQRTIKSILDNIFKFTNTQFILSSFESLKSIRQFYFDYGLSSYTTVFIGQEIDYTLTKQIQYSSFPCLILFDENKQYIKKIDEESDVKKLLKALHIKTK